MAHARLSPSSASRWMTCPGSAALCDGEEDEGSEYAAEGTAAHELAERILLGADGKTLVGQRAENGVKWTKDMLRDVMVYVTLVQDMVASTGGKLHVEVKVPIGHLTGEEDAHGTSDEIIVTDEELIVGDLKFGRGVEVSAVENEQLRIYALGALEKIQEDDPLYLPKTVRLVISQPRLHAVSEWSEPLESLLAFGEKVKAAAQECGHATTLKALMDPPVWAEQMLNPSEDACRWCKAKAVCPKLQAEVIALFDTVDPNSEPENAVLGEAMAKVGLVEGWCKAIRARCESELLAGNGVPGWKLVKGRNGPRKWADADEAEALLKTMKLRVDKMYDLSLISPTTAEELATEKVLGPRQWKKLLEHITRSEGKPSVAPESDKRAALPVSAVVDEFNDETLVDDLL